MGFEPQHQLLSITAFEGTTGPPRRPAVLDIVLGGRILSGNLYFAQARLLLRGGCLCRVRSGQFICSDMVEFTKASLQTRLAKRFKTPDRCLVTMTFCCNWSVPRGLSARQFNRQICNITVAGM